MVLIAVFETIGATENVLMLMKWIASWIQRAFLAAIRMYQSTASMRPRVCRYHPTCSEYAAQCIRKYGVFVGVALGIRRILRCNPFSPGGSDPIP